MIRKGFDAILKEFMERHPELLNLKPELEITADAEDSKSVPVLEILVKHDFIFDNRLVPDEFDGTKVINVILVSTLPKYFNPRKDKPLWKVEDPSNYIKFVEENSQSIREKLNSPTMTKTEMLEALTGGFEKHLSDWKKMVRDWFNYTEQ